MSFTPHKYITAVVCFVVLLPQVVSAQLQVTASSNANALAQSLVGQGVSVSNAVLFAAPNQAGFFNGINSNIGISSGIILTSGSVANAVGPNTTGGATTVAGQPGFPLLTQQAGVQTHDRCVLQFDVIPFADTLVFRYSFASEEYPEFVCSGFNDAFGFFISGPNPSGPAYVDRNVALIPGTGTLVAINSVNPGTPGAGYPAGGCISLNYSNFYVSNTGGATVQYDGWTRSFKAQLIVVPCSTYTFKLAIADGGDQLYDSGVFLEEGSLTANGNSVESRTSAGLAYTSMIEGCLDGQIIIRRNGSNNGSPQTVNIQTGGTATNGVDYTTIPGTVTIPAGQDSIILNIQGFQDGLNENFESLIVYLLSPCQGNVLDSTLIYIEDSLHIQIFPGDTSICQGESVQLLAIGGGNFQWSPPAGLNNTGINSPTATPTATTTYTVTGHIQSCYASNTVRITVNNYPTVSVSPDTGICLGSNTQLQATVVGPGATYQWSPPTGLSSTTVLNPFANPTTTTTYTLTAISGLNCSTQASVNVTVFPFPQANAGPDVTFCAGDSVQLQASGGVSYSWSPVTGLSDPTIANPIAKPTSTTFYTVQVTNANGCSANDIVKVTVNQPPAINLGPDKNICAGSSVQLQAIGALSYQWSPAATLNNPNIANPTATPGQTTTYTVVGTTNGCSTTDTVRVMVHPLPTPSIQPSATIVCPGQTIQLQASGGIAFQWAPAAGLSNPNVANPVATMTQDVTYTVTVTNANGCTGIDSIKLRVHTLPTISTGGNDSICYGQSTTLSASGGVSYNWSPAASLSNPNIANPVASPTNTTNYTLQVTDANGCQNTDQVTITVMPLPNANAGPDRTACEGDVINLNGSGGATYKWIPTGGLSCSNCQNPSWISTANRSFTMTAFSLFGCIDKDTVDIQVTPAPNTQVSASAPGTCPGGTVQLTAAGGDTYTWQAGILGLSSYNIPDPVATPPATTKYYVTVRDNTTGCSALDSIIIQVYPLPNVQVSPDDTICLGENKVLQASGANSYSWAPAGTLSASNGKTVTATPTSTTQYTVTGTDNKGCKNTAQVQVKVNPLPTANAGSDQTICKGSVTQLTGAGGGTYQWSPSTGLSCNQCQNPSTVVSASRSYILKVTDGNGCVDRDTVALTVLSLPPVNAGQDVTLCPGGSTQLQATGALNYSWGPSTGLTSTTIPDPVATPSSAVTYTVTGTDANGCQKADSVRVDFFPFTPVNAGTDVSICAGESTQLQAQNANQYTWTPAATLSDPTIANPTATPATTTIYTVNATDGNGCTSIDQVMVTVRPIPNIVLMQGDTTLCVDKSVQLGATGGTIFTWSPAAGLSNPNIANPIASPTSATEYTVTVENSVGCTDQATVQIDFYPITDPNAQPTTIAICPGDSVQLTSDNGVTYSWDPGAGLSNASIADPVAIPGQTTIYTLTIQDVNGCVFTDEVEITVHPTPWADAGIDGSVFIGESIQLNGTGNGSFEWTPHKWLDFPFSGSPVSTPDSSIWYTLTVTTTKGCTAFDSMYIKVHYETVVFMPNAFSPNGDGQNDVFKPKWYHEFELQEFRIYNRWGTLMYSSSDGNSGWDGTYEGVPQPIGTYTYVVHGVGNRGQTFFKRGNITLIR